MTESGHADALARAKDRESRYTIAIYIVYSFTRRSTLCGTASHYVVRFRRTVRCIAFIVS
jgi:hypothetical protein